MQVQARELTINEILSGKILESGEILTRLGICSKNIKLTCVVIDKACVTKGLIRTALGDLTGIIVGVDFIHGKEIKVFSPFEFVGQAVRPVPNCWLFIINEVKTLDDASEVSQRYKTILENRLKHLDYVEQIQKVSPPEQSEEDINKISSELKLPLSKDDIKHILTAQKTFGPINVGEIRKDCNSELKTLATIFPTACQGGMKNV